MALMHLLLESRACLSPPEVRQQPMKGQSYDAVVANFGTLFCHRQPVTGIRARCERRKGENAAEPSGTGIGQIAGYLEGLTAIRRDVEHAKPTPARRSVEWGGNLSCSVFFTPP